MYITKEISLLQALTGVNFSITHLDGRKIRIQSEPGVVIEPESTMTAEDLGMPFQGKSFNFGNLFIKFEIKFPTQLDPNQMAQATQALAG